MAKNNAKLTCSNCGKPANRVRGNYLFRESGMSNVVLKDLQILKCDACGNQDPIIPGLNEIMKLLAWAIVKKPSPLNGAEVRFLRKFTNNNGETFASLLGVDRTTLSKWENNQIQIGANSDRLVRAVVLGLGEGLEEYIKEGMKSFSGISEERTIARIELDTSALKFEYA